MFLSARNISLTGQCNPRPRKCPPHPLRDGGGLLTEGPSPCLIFPDASNPPPVRSRAMFLCSRNISLTSQGDTRPIKCTHPLRDGGDLLAEGPSLRLVFPDSSNPSPGRSRAMFLSARNISLTSQRNPCPRKCPHPLRNGGGLLAEGPSRRSTFPDASNPPPGRSRAMFLPPRNISLTSQCDPRARKFPPSLCSAAGDTI